MPNRPNRGLSVRCPLCGVGIGFHCRHPVPGDYHIRGGQFPEPSEWQGTERRPHRVRVELEDEPGEMERRERIRAAVEVAAIEERVRLAAEEGKAKRAERLVSKRQQLQGEPPWMKRLKSS